MFNMIINVFLSGVVGVEMVMVVDAGLGNIFNGSEIIK